MKENTAVYANGFTFLLSKEGGEAVLVFTQNQPKYDERKKAFSDNEGIEVETVIILYKMVHGLCDALQDALRKEEEKEFTRS